jgi:hypothetical protein
LAVDNGRRLTWASIALGAFGFGAFLWAFAPHHVICFNDDVGYLRSVVATLQRGRPWTDDFLEPWAWSLSVTVAAIYRLTGHFTFAVLGVQIAASVASFIFAAKAAAENTRSWTISLLLPLAVLLFPTALWKQAEFTALVLYLPALLAAVWSARQERWALFTVATMVGLGCRQSAIAWLALPVGCVIRDGSRRARRSIAAPLAAAGVGVTWAVALWHFANRTHAQVRVTGGVFRAFDLHCLTTNVVIAAWILVTAAGIVSLVADPAGRRSTGARRFTERVVGAALLATLSFVARGVPLSYEHPLFDVAFGAWFLRGIVALAAVGWWMQAPRMPAVFVGGAAAVLALPVLRGELWDYYLIDAVVMVGWGVLATVDRSSEAPQRLWPVVLGRVALVGIVAGELVLSSPLKRSLDERAGACVVLEHALRARWMKPTELSHAPFGFVAWHLFPYYVAHEGRASADLAGFGMYVAQRAVDVGVDDLPRGAAAPANPDPAHPFAEIRPHGWLTRAAFWLQRREDPIPPRVALDEAAYRELPFPLNDVEWRALIDRGHRSP